MTQHTSPLILVDGSSYLFRAYYALPPLTTQAGQPTGAIYGVLNMLRSLVKTYDPTYLGVVFDPKGKTHRHTLYPEYKANRVQMPDELACQIAPLHDAIRALGYPLIIVDGAEADDVIATLARQAVAQQCSVVISTGDKDLAQLVDEQITLVNTMSKQTLDIEGVEKKFGVSPKQIVDYLALIGDNVDNIPGVPKVGPKTAAKWLAAYGSLERIMAEAETIKGKVGESLRENLEQLQLSKTLVTIDDALPLSVTLDELRCHSPNIPVLSELFTQLEFKTWLADLKEQHQAPSREAANRDYQCVTTKKQLTALQKTMNAATRIAFDTETTSLNDMQARLVGMSVAVTPHEAYYIPVGHDYPEAPTQLPLAEVLSVFRPILENPKKIIIGQNLKYDIKVLRHYDLRPKAQLHDTMLASYVLSSTGTRHDLDGLAHHYLGEQTMTFESIAGKGVKQKTFNEIDMAVATDYAAEDADIALRLYDTLLEKIEAVPSMTRVLTDIEWPLMPILADMEYQGVLIDDKALKKQSRALAKQLATLQEEIYTLADCEFNIDSPKQLQAVLYDQLNLPVIKKTPTGQPSTNESVMLTLAIDYELPKLILDYRRLGKLKSTYTDKLPTLIHPDTGRVHTSYNQAVTATGRLSSNNPNLQNIPARTPEGRKIRQAFIAPPGYKIMAADYSQVELRIMAHLSQDPGLLNAFEHGYDVHRATAAEVFAVDLDAVTPEQRRQAKAINFGLMYGMSSFGLSQQLGMSRKAAQQYIDIYFERYPNVQAYMATARKQAAEQGYVETVLGRRLWIPDIQSKQFTRRSAAERAAINAPLQGTAADVIKLAMICIHQWLEKSQVDARMLMQVHDELVFEVAEAQIDAARDGIRHCMEQSVELTVPLLVDIGVGNNWDQAH